MPKPWLRTLRKNLRWRRRALELWCRTFYHPQKPLNWWGSRVSKLTQPRISDNQDQVVAWNCMACFMRPLYSLDVRGQRMSWQSRSFAGHRRFNLGRCLLTDGLSLISHIHFCLLIPSFDISVNFPFSLIHLLWTHISRVLWCMWLTLPLDQVSAG